MNFDKPADPPELENDHVKLDELLMPLMQDVLSCDIDLAKYVSNEIVKYAVGIDFYKYLSMPMSQQYKYNHWSGEEIYPEEEKEYFDNAAKIKAYYFNNVYKLLEKDQNSEKKDSESNENNIDIERDALTIVIQRKEEWKASANASYFNMRQSNYSEKEMKKHQENFKNLAETIEMELNALFNKLFGFDYSWQFDNNFGATAKYGIIHAHSRKIDLFDTLIGNESNKQKRHYFNYERNENDLYVTVYANCVNLKRKRERGFSGYYLFEPQTIIIRIVAVVVSSDSYCKIHMPFYM